MTHETPKYATTISTPVGEFALFLGEDERVLVYKMVEATSEEEGIVHAVWRVCWDGSMGDKP